MRVLGNDKDLNTILFMNWRNSRSTIGTIQAQIFSSGMFNSSEPLDKVILHLIILLRIVSVLATNMGPIQEAWHNSSPPADISPPLEVSPPVD